MKGLLPRCCLGLLLATILLQPVFAVSVRDVRLWAGPDNTRVVVDLSGSAQHSLDVPGAQLGKGAHRLPAGAGAVKQVRMSRSSSGNLRVVLDLSRPTQAKSFLTRPN